VCMAWETFPVEAGWTPALTRKVWIRYE
jgi:hypothetical protein